MPRRPPLPYCQVLIDDRGFLIIRWTVKHERMKYSETYHIGSKVRCSWTMTPIRN